MSYSNLKEVRCEVENSILWLWLNRPEAHNAISEKMIDELVATLALAEADPQIKVIVLSGMGESFCAGGDVKAMQKREGMFAGDSVELAQRYRQGIQRIPRQIESMHKPLIAMVNGNAVGAGCDIACMCDLRIGSEKAVFCESFARLALVPGDGGTWFLPRIVGYAKAMEMFLTGERYDAQSALKMQLLNCVAPHADLRAVTSQWAQKILRQSPVALAMTKQALKQASKLELGSALELLSWCQAITQRTPDHEQAVDKLLNKKNANAE